MIVPMHATIVRIVTPFFLLNPNLSHNDESKGSNSANDDVIPANSIEINSNGAKICPTMPISLNICGNTMNISPVPSLINSFIGIDEDIDMYPSMENTPRAMKISYNVFAITTKSTSSTSFEFLGR